MKIDPKPLAVPVAAPKRDTEGAKAPQKPAQPPQVGYSGRDVFEMEIPSKKQKNPG